MTILLLFALNLGLIWYLLHGDRGVKESRRNLLIAAGFGFLALILASFTSGNIPDAWFGENSDAGVAVRDFPLLLFGAIVVGLTEEAVKFIPAALWLRKKPFFDEMTDGLIYFGIIAVVFGLTEDLIYGLQYGESTVLSRLISGPFTHVAFTMIPAMAFTRYRLFHKKFITVVLALMYAGLLHAAYDFGVSTDSTLLILVSFGISIVCNVLIFTKYRKAQKIDAIRDSRVAVTGESIIKREDR